MYRTSNWNPDSASACASATYFAWAWGRRMIGPSAYSTATSFAGAVSSNSSRFAPMNPIQSLSASGAVAFRRVSASTPGHQ
jgi:hypothetical protein